MDAFKALFADVPAISVVYIRSLLSLGKEHDVNLLPDCHELGIDDTLLANPEGAVSINQMLNLVERADHLFTHPNWAVELGQTWGLQTHGMNALPLFHRDNPLDVARLALSNLSLRLPFINLLARVEGDDLLILLDEHWPLGQIRARILEIYFGSLVRFVSQMGKKMTLCLDADYHGSNKQLAGIGDCAIKLQHPRCQLIMHNFSDGNFIPGKTNSTNTATTPPPNTQNQQMLLLIRRLVTMDPGRSCTIELVAEKLGSTPRTLSRYLRAAGQSFSEMRNSVRCQHAQRYLRESGVPIIDIAERLGYSDQASFSKAFRSWTGQTPGDYRRSQQTPEAREESDGKKKRA